MPPLCPSLPLCFFWNPITPPTFSLLLSLQLLHTSRVINSRDVLVLKACKTEHPLSAERTPCLSSTEMGHLVRNPIKHIPHKVGLFGYFSLSLASLKSYYLFKVPHITPSRQCQCLTVSSLIALINYPRAPKHTAWVLLFGNIWIEDGLINHITTLRFLSSYSVSTFASHVQYVAYISIL